MRSFLPIILFTTAFAIIGCSNGFTSGSSANENGIPSLGPNDVVGAGGSIALMQAGSSLTHSLAITGPGGVSFSGGWVGGCIVGTGGSASSIRMAVSSYDVFMVLHQYIGTPTCDSSGLDMVETRHYTYNSLGTASMSFSANTLSSFLVQVIQQPQTVSAVNAINTDCGITTAQIGTDVDVSICTRFGSGTSSVTNPKVGVTDSSGLFYTNGSILRLGDSNGLAASGTVGYFTKQ